MSSPPFFLNHSIGFSTDFYYFLNMEPILYQELTNKDLQLTLWWQDSLPSSLGRWRSCPFFTQPSKFHLHCALWISALCPLSWPPVDSGSQACPGITTDPTNRDLPNLSSRSHCLLVMWPIILPSFSCSILRDKYRVILNTHLFPS